MHIGPAGNWRQCDHDVWDVRRTSRPSCWLCSSPDFSNRSGLTTMTARGRWPV